MFFNCHLEFPEDFKVFRDKINGLPVTKIVFDSYCCVAYTIVLQDEHLDDFVSQLMISYALAKADEENKHCHETNIDF